MKTIEVSKVTETIKEMCIEANHYLTEDMKEALQTALENEASPLGKQVLNQLQENLHIADQEQIPICQDTGMAVIFMEIGQQVHFIEGQLEEAIQVYNTIALDIRKAVNFYGFNNLQSDLRDAWCIGGGAQMAMQEAGITLYGGNSGSADEAVQAFLAQTLVQNENPTCDHHHDHGEGHSCGNHSCGEH